MTIHYHVTPITPVAALVELQGRNFLVSHARADDVERVHQIGQSVLLDNGAYSRWKQQLAAEWTKYYAWCEKWLAYPTTWAIIPDEINAGAQYQDALIAEWPFGHRGAPVWHMNESIDRLLHLLDTWPRVCIGSTDEFAQLLTPVWERRMDDVWEAITRRHRFIPWLHMLRGMQLVGMRWPFASLDSSDIGQNHHRPYNSPRKMADRWDAMQNGAVWHPVPEQLVMT